jgi:hypothetical protein
VGFVGVDGGTTDSCDARHGFARLADQPDHRRFELSHERPWSPRSIDRSVLDIRRAAP